MERDGYCTGSTRYVRAQWREHSIRARRFAACPHCGGTVAGSERRWTAPDGSESMVFFEAHCLREACGWHYFAHSGTRDEFVAAVNERSSTNGKDIGRAVPGMRTDA